MALDDDLLQRYHDGDLTPDEALSVRTEVAKSPDARRRLAELAALREMMQAPLHEAARGLDGDALFARIQAGIQQQQQAGFGERLRVLSSEWFEHKRGVLVPAAASLAAAAAALIILLVPREAKHPVGAGTMFAQLHGTRIENVDFGHSTGTVFEVDNQGVTAAVVWISDDEEAP